MFFGYVFNGGWLKLVSEFTLLQGDWGNNDNDWQLKKLQHDSLKTSEKVVEVLRETIEKEVLALAKDYDRLFGTRSAQFTEYLTMVAQKLEQHGIEHQDVIKWLNALASEGSVPRDYASDLRDSQSKTVPFIPGGPMHDFGEQSLMDKSLGTQGASSQRPNMPSSATMTQFDFTSLSDTPTRPTPSNGHGNGNGNGNGHSTGLSSTSQTLQNEPIPQLPPESPPNAMPYPQQTFQQNFDQANFNQPNFDQPNPSFSQPTAFVPPQAPAPPPPVSFAQQPAPIPGAFNIGLPMATGLAPAPPPLPVPTPLPVAAPAQFAPAMPAPIPAQMPQPIPQPVPMQQQAPAPAPAPPPAYVSMPVNIPDVSPQPQQQMQDKREDDKWVFDPFTAWD